VGEWCEWDVEPREEVRACWVPARSKTSIDVVTRPSRGP
jgi:hypothetical protein